MCGAMDALSASFLVGQTNPTLSSVKAADFFPAIRTFRKNPGDVFEQKSGQLGGAVAVLLLVFLLAGVHESNGQSMMSGIDSVGVSHNFMPALSYDSDLGLVGGGFYLRTLQRPGYNPYKDRLRVAALASTKGYLEGNVRYEWLKSFGGSIRSRLDVTVNRMLNDYYFGIGNNTIYRGERLEEDYYFFRSVNFGFDYKGRMPLNSSPDGKNRHLDLLLLAGVEYEIPYVKQQQSTMNLSPPPTGTRGGWLNYVGTGLLWDSRNTEIAPKRGLRMQIQGWYAPKILLSDFQMSMLRTDLRHYFTFHLIKDITVANRLLMRRTAGEVPYWQMSTMGDSDRMRGYHTNRFMGKSMIVHSLELRTWLLEWPEYSFKIGGQLFMDTGRVFSERDQTQHVLEDYHQTYGFGGAMTLFDPDFLFRGDIGFSNDGIQLYVGTQYAF